MYGWTQYWCPLWSRFTSTPSYHGRVSPPTARERLQRSNRQKRSNRESSISRQRTQLKPPACPGSRPLAEVSPVGRHYKLRTASAVHLSRMRQRRFLCEIDSAARQQSAEKRLDVSVEPAQMFWQIDISHSLRGRRPWALFFPSTEQKSVTELMDSCGNCTLKTG